MISADEIDVMTGNGAELEEEAHLDLDVALLAALAARDVGDGVATADVDLGDLSETEKRALLELAGKRLGLHISTSETGPAAPRKNPGT